MNFGHGSFALKLPSDREAVGDSETRPPCSILNPHGHRDPGRLGNRRPSLNL